MASLLSRLRTSPVLRHSLVSNSCQAGKSTGRPRYSWPSLPDPLMQHLQLRTLSHMAVDCSAGAAISVQEFSTSHPPQSDHSTKPGLPTVGFVGVGNMGSPMATNLLRFGFPVIVYDHNEEAMQKMVQRGAGLAESPRHIAETPGVAVVISMLPATQHVAAAYEGPDGFLSASGGVRPWLFVDCSTILPAYSMELEKMVHGRPRHSSEPESTILKLSTSSFIDAPVSGGVPGAAAATLTFMCGGREDAVAAATHVLQPMGKRVLHMGKTGAGQAAKLCNNMACAIEMAAVSEALALGAAVGLDPRQLSDVFNTSSARCWSSEAYNPCPGLMPGVPSASGYSGGFGAHLMLKDLRLGLQMAKDADQPTHMANLASKLYEKVVSTYSRDSQDEAGRTEAGHKGPASSPLDFSAIYEVVYKGKRSA